MLCCAYCGQAATIQIVSNPGRVCLVHALEFWTGLLMYAKDRSDRCVRQKRLCASRLCAGLTAPDRRAIAAAEPSARDGALVQIRLAS